MRFECRGVVFSYVHRTSGRRRVLDGLSLAIAPGECVGIIGHEGVGKSTLLQLLAGLLKPDSGTILVEGEDLWGKSGTASSYRKKLGFAFQFPEQQFFCETVRDELMSLTASSMTPEEALDMVKLRARDYLDRSPYSLSMGEARRVALALLFMRGPEALLLDEPTVGLDGAGIGIVLDLLLEARLRGTTTVIVSHDLDVLAEAASCIVIMDHGRADIAGSTESILTDEERLARHGYEVPEIVRLMKSMNVRPKPGALKDGLLAARGVMPSRPGGSREGTGQ